MGLFQPGGGPFLTEVGPAGQAGLTPTTCVARMADYECVDLQEDIGADLDDSA